jgi:hypothetical protein
MQKQLCRSMQAFSFPETLRESLEDIETNLHFRCNNKQYLIFKN